MEAGTQLGHYTVLAAIGRGGMGEVWKARDTKLGREVAIKTLPEEFSQDPERLARFEREAKLLASLNHPNIAAIYGFEKDKGSHFLVMEYVPGETLADRLTRGAIPVEESLKIALQIAEALEAAHEKTVVHRDLKPANVKVTPEGRVKVLDFGLAKAFAGDAEDVSLSNSPTLSMAATQQGVILGTAAYMSPEQAKGREVDKRTDVWAFGCVIYEMLTGQQAFRGEEVSEILASVIAREPDYKALPANLHPRLREILDRCLQKNVRRRFQGIGDVIADIEKVLSDPGGAFVRPAAEVAQATPSSKLPWVAAIVLGIVVSGVVAWNVKPGSSPGLVSRFLYDLPDEQGFSRTGQTLVAVSPDGSRMVYVANGQLHLRAMDTLESTPISGTDEDPSAPFFSPDGEWVGYFSNSDNQLKKIAPSGGAPVTLCGAANLLGAPSWERDDTIIFGQPKGIMRVSANGGTPEVLVPNPGDANLEKPQILPDGDSLLFSMGNVVQGQVVLRSLESGEQTVLFPGVDPTYVPTGHLIYGIDGVLFAVPFDLGTLKVTGGPVPLVEGVRTTAQMQYAVSDSGTLVYVSGGNSMNKLLALADPGGAVKSLDVPPMRYANPRFSPDGSRLAVDVADGEGSDIWVYDLSGRAGIQLLIQEGNNRRSPGPPTVSGSLLAPTARAPGAFTGRTRMGAAWRNG